MSQLEFVVYTFRIWRRRRRFCIALGPLHGSSSPFRHWATEGENQLSQRITSCLDGWL